LQLLEELCVDRPEGVLHAQRAEGDEEVAEKTGSARAVQPIRAGHGTTHPHDDPEVDGEEAANRRQERATKLLGHMYM
jgi:hypothetical protein